MKKHLANIVAALTLSAITGLCWLVWDTRERVIVLETKFAARLTAVATVHPPP